MKERYDYGYNSRIRVSKVLSELNTLTSFIEEMKAYDVTLYMHSYRVAVVSAAFAKYLGYSKKFRIKLITSALLHDIGKVFIPKEILNKSGELSTVEFQLIKTHVASGYAYIKETLPKVPEIVTDAILYHHENWNGSGYIFNLAGAHIPLAAQLLRIVDSFDAIVSRRVYKGEVSVESARLMLVKDLSAYNPTYLRLFIQF